MKLVIWDIDGTLVDSHAMIMDSMAAGMAAAGLAPLPDRTVSGIVGLSLPVAVRTLLPGHDEAVHAAVVEGYRTHYSSARAEAERLNHLGLGTDPDLKLLETRVEVVDDAVRLTHVFERLSTHNRETAEPYENYG